MAAPIRIGTQGWNYDAWVGPFYPDGTRPVDFLSIYARAFGLANILCNNAGANFRVSFDEQTEEQWHTIIEVGLTGAFLGIKAVVGVSDLGGNWAFGNGDPLQCLNIVCNRRPHQ